jgi:transposase
VEVALSRLPTGTTIAVESTGSWWWFVDTARRLGHQVVLSHPKLTKAIAAARLKSDKVDAVMLARLLKADLLPMVWIPAERDRHMRELLAHRGRVVRARTAVINELHALYSKRNLEVPRYLWHRIRPVPWHPDELGGYGPRIVQENVALLKALNEQISGLDCALKALAEDDPEAMRLMTHPGVGAVTAVAVRAWVGDIQRFASAKHLVSYFGLAPRVRQSADRERHGHISKEGNRMVRTLLLQAAISVVRHTGGPVRRHYLGVLKRRGKKIARIAAANKLLGVLFQMMKQGLTYEEVHQRGDSAQ